MKGSSKGRYDETFAGEDAVIMDKPLSSELVSPTQCWIALH